MFLLTPVAWPIAKLLLAYADRGAMRIQDVARVFDCKDFASLNCLRCEGLTMFSEQTTRDGTTSPPRLILAPAKPWCSSASPYACWFDEVPELPRRDSAGCRVQHRWHQRVGLFG